MLSVVDEGGAKVQVQTSDGMRATCEGLTIHVNGVEPLRVSVLGKQVQAHCGAQECQAGNGCDALQLSADRVSRSGPDGALLTLEGNAKLLCIRRGKRAEMAAEQISFHLVTGHIDCEMGQQPPAPAIVPCGTSAPCTRPTCTTGSSSKPKKQDGEQVFQFYSFFR
jgi:hypothetical protein